MAAVGTIHVPVAVVPATAGDLHADDIVILDPVYGAERVLHADEMTLSNGVLCAHLHVARDDSSRFVVRGAHEPVLQLP